MKKQNHWLGNPDEDKKKKSIGELKKRGVKIKNKGNINGGTGQFIRSPSVAFNKDDFDGFDE